MEKSITIEVRSAYGQDRFYPYCDAAKAFASIAGTVTLSRDVLKFVKSLGYTIEVKTKTLDI